ncbi:hypothetical protein D3C72_1089400 [compost metagenome]
MVVTESSFDRKTGVWYCFDIKIKSLTLDLSTLYGTCGSAIHPIGNPNIIQGQCCPQSVLDQARLGAELPLVGPLRLKGLYPGLDIIGIVYNTWRNIVECIHIIGKERNAVFYYLVN